MRVTAYALAASAAMVSSAIFPSDAPHVSVTATEVQERHPATQSTTPSPTTIPSTETERPQVEVCFVLDTTGSMAGLIAGAKAKIWSIANQIVSAKPTPRVRFGLVAYRDRGDHYITRVHDLSDDLDTVYADLQKFEAGGGGDGPESVNQALHEALTRMSWSTDRETLRIMFLVGDSPPHMDYPNDIPYLVTCEASARRGIIINTVQCGSMPETNSIWQEIARRAEGRYTSIGQSGDVQVVETPMDAEIAKLNVEIGKTLLPYGDLTVRGDIAVKRARSEAAPASEGADRLSVLWAARGVSVSLDASAVGGDLIDDLKSGRRRLADVKEDELPEELRKLPAEVRPARIQELREQREKVQQRITKLLRERDEFILKELAAREKVGAKEGFDQKVAAMLTELAARKGIRLEKKP